MRGISVRNPERSLAICLGATAIAIWAVGTGALELRAAGYEAAVPSAKVGIGLLFLIMSPMVALNFYRGVRAIAALKAGKRVIARWTVPTGQFAKFTEADARRSALGVLYQNWLRPREERPGGGVEVIVGDDAVLVGEEYIGLPASGLVRFGGVQMLGGEAPMIEFGVAFTSVSETSAIKVRTERGAVRIPVAQGAEELARLVLRHFEAVRAGRVAANPGFWPSRRRIGLAVLGVGAVAAAAGFAFRDTGAVVAMVAAIIGVLAAIVGLIVAAIAWFADPLKDKKFL